MSFELSFKVAWGDLDANGHMANTAYLDYASQSRFAYLATLGFGPAAFVAHGIGPVIFEDRLCYRRELRLLQPFSVSLHLSGLSSEGRHFALENRFADDDGRLAATVRARAAWFDLEQRRVTQPPPPLREAWQTLPRSDDFEILRRQPT